MRKDCTCPRARHQHGTRAMYLYCGCRCPECTIANTRHCKANRLRAHYGRQVPPTKRLPAANNTMLRLRALTWLGYTPKAIGAMLSLDARRLAECRNGKTRYVWPSTETAVRDLYERLWDKPAPASRSAGQARALARARGWPAPLMLDEDSERVTHINPIRDNHGPDIDPIAVEEAIAGRAVKLTKAERAEAIRRLTACRYTAKQAAERLRISPRSVQRGRGKAA